MRADQIKKKQKITFDFKKTQLNIFACIREIKKINPDVVILFLHLKDIVIWPLIHILRLKKIPVIYWNHGINLQTPNNKIKNAFFHYVHNISDAIILYSPNELKYIEPKNHKKTFIAYNTLNFNSFPDIKRSKKELLNKYNVKTRKNVLFVGRIQPRKRLDDLLKCFENIEKRIGLIVVGPGIQKKQMVKINRIDNIKYFGPIYDNVKINEIFKMCDLFSIPGTNGLGLNQAFYWGLPAVAENVNHSPEIFYLKQEKNGYIVPKGDIRELRERIKHLLMNEDLYKKFSQNARKTIQKEGSIERMYEGFQKAMEFCLDGK